LVKKNNLLAGSAELIQINVDVICISCSNQRV